MVAINVLALFAALSSVAVAAPHNSRSRAHNGVAARFAEDRHSLPIARTFVARGAGAQRRCRPRPAADSAGEGASAGEQAPPADAPAADEAAPAPAPAPEQPAPSPEAPADNNNQEWSGDNNNNNQEWNNDNNNQDWNNDNAHQEQPQEDNHQPAQDFPETSNAWAAPAHGGLIQVNDGRCGGAQASDAEPNGREDWINCGIEDGGWNPPHVGPWDLKSVGLEHPHFSACGEYFEKFNRHGHENGIPPVLLASIALQESGCKKDTSGRAGGENGLMQITHDKCAAGTDCKDPEYNIGAAARFLKGLVDNAGGNVLLALGQYNGWRAGLTVDQAKAADWQGNCHAQNNLDYMYQLVNGHMQGKEAWQMGRWLNLAHC